MREEFNKLCSPAKFYFVIALISIFIALFSKVYVSVILVKVIFAFIYTYILNLLCKKGYKNFSWFLVLFPYIVMLLFVMRFIKVTKQH